MRERRRGGLLLVAHARRLRVGRRSWRSTRARGFRLRFGESPGRSRRRGVDVLSLVLAIDGTPALRRRRRAARRPCIAGGHPRRVVAAAADARQLVGLVFDRFGHLRGSRDGVRTASDSSSTPGSNCRRAFGCPEGAEFPSIGTRGAANDATSRAVDHRKRGQAVGDRDRRNPGLSLVGYAWSADKVGRDVGELCGVAKLGVTATDDVDALLALRPDCVVYNPMWPSVDELVRILSAGVNVVSTAAFINGRRLGPDRKRLVDACERGGSSLLGTGINPGFAELLGIVVAGICDRIDKSHDQRGGPHRALRLARHRDAGGFGRPIDHPELPADDRRGHRGVRRGRAMVADALGVELDEVVCEAEHAKTTTDLDLGSGRSPRAASPASRPAGRAAWALDRGRAERALEEGACSSPTGRSRTVLEVGLPTIRSTCSSSAAGLPGQAARGLHGARPHHDGMPPSTRSPSWWPRSRDGGLCRSPAAASARPRPSLDGGFHLSQPAFRVMKSQG